MSKVLTFSTKFPKGHKRVGEPTFFVEQIWNSEVQEHTYHNESGLEKYRNNFLNTDYYNGELVFNIKRKKLHTIRSGKRWRVGDKFSPRIWSGKPYCSPQIEIGSDIEIKKIYDIEMSFVPTFFENGKVANVTLSGIYINGSLFLDWNTLAQNDGLSMDDFCNWFGCSANGNFSGQIICWSDDLNYENE